MAEHSRFAFAPVRAADFPRLHRWLQEPYVRAHDDDGLRTLDAVVAYDTPCVRGDEPTRLYIASIRLIPSRSA